MRRSSSANGDSRIKGGTIALVLLVLASAITILAAVSAAAGDEQQVLFDPDLKAQQVSIRYRFTTLFDEDELSAAAGTPEFDHVCGMLEQLNDAVAIAQETLSPNDSGSATTLELTGQHPVLYQFYDMGIESSEDTAAHRYWVVDWTATRWEDWQSFIREAKDYLKDG